MERRLAAILAADVVGYSRLMGEDEAGTLARLNALRRETLEPLITAHRGRIFKLMGDGLLVEFASVVDAVTCGLAWQKEVAQLENGLGADQALRFRIGINLGDVIVEGEDVHGDGVNIAARLEALAEPGGVCLSADAHRHARGKVEASFRDLGERQLKNIAEPVQVYAVTLEGSEAARERGARRQALQADRPTIAVLPLANRTGDPEQDYFSDGITEDIITELARLPIVQVVARHASFAFKGKDLDLSDVGRQLGAHYLLDGSLRRAANRVRITVQLVETETGRQVWAERFDRELDDIFAVQDEITRSIVAVLPGRVQDAVADRVVRKPTSSMSAYECLLQGKAIRDSFTADSTLKARAFFEKAVEIDPHYAKAYGLLADTYFVDTILGLADEADRQIVYDMTRRAVALDSGDVSLQEALGFAYIAAGLWADAESQFDRTLTQIVNQAEQLMWCAYGLMMVGRPEEARDLTLEAKRLDPLHPPSFDWVLGQACSFAKDYEQAIKVLKGEALLNSLAYCCLTGAYARLGLAEEASRTLKTFVKTRREEFDSRGITAAGDTVEALAGSYRNILRRASDWDHLAEGLCQAGLEG